jgi:hypothetical protein
MHPQPTGAVDTAIQQEQVGRLTSRVDSLERQLRDHRVNEGYFTTILEQQVALFCLVISAILALAGLAGWGWFSRKMRRMRREYRETLRRQRRRVDRLRDRTEGTQTLLDSTTADTHHRIAQLCEYSRAMKAVRLAATLHAAAFHYKSGGKEDATARAELLDAKSLVVELPTDPYNMRRLKAELGAICRSLEMIAVEGAAPAAQDCAEIRVRLEGLISLYPEDATTEAKDAGSDPSAQ